MPVWIWFVAAGVLGVHSKKKDNSLDTSPIYLLIQ